MNRRRGDPSLVAAIATRLAVLLAAGVTPASAWGYLDSAPVTRDIAAAGHSGASIADAIGRAAQERPASESAAWRAFATAWAVATDAGAPLAPTLRDFASTLRDLAQSQREIDVALASPRSTARLVMALPMVGVVFGLLLGFDTVGILLTTAAGWLCIGMASALLFAASRWNRRLVDRAQPTDFSPGLTFDLVAIALSGGASIDRAVSSVGRAAARFGLAVENSSLAAVLELSRRAGVPAAALLRGEALERRRDCLAAAHAAARRLGVQLMIPLGVCVLPAFMVVSVVPVVLAVLGQTSELG